MENIRWKPAEGEDYYSINTCGKIVKNKWYDLEFDNGCYKMGNCFKTEEEALITLGHHLAEL